MDFKETMDKAINTCDAISPELQKMGSKAYQELDKAILYFAEAAEAARQAGESDFQKRMSSIASKLKSAKGV